MPVLIAATTAAADSADVTLAAGASVTFLLNGGLLGSLPYGAVALIQAKSGAQYVTIGQIDSQNPLRVLAASGVFRVSKQISDGAVGVDQN